MATRSSESPSHSSDNSRHHSRVPSGQATPRSTAFYNNRSTMHFDEAYGGSKGGSKRQSGSNFPLSSYNGSRALSMISVASNESQVRMSTSTTAIKCDVMIQFLRQRQLEKLWSDGAPDEGVIMRRSKNDFVCQPQDLAHQGSGFFSEIYKLNVKVGRLSKMFDKALTCSRSP